jgi:hypothetical protein
MICCTDILLDIQLSANGPGERHSEAWVSIRNDFLRYPIVWEHLLHIDSGHPCGVHILAAWEKESHFGAIVIHNCEHQIKAPCFW